MSYVLAQAIRRVVCSTTVPACLSNRAKDALGDAKRELWWFDPTRTTLRDGSAGRLQWWTHGGTIANIRLAWCLQQALGAETRSDDMSVTMPEGMSRDDALRAIADLATAPLEFDAQAFRPLAEKLKFFEALPELRVAQLCEARYNAREAIRAILAEGCRGVTLAP
jgi:hypothetical protein